LVLKFKSGKLKNWQCGMWPWLPVFITDVLVLGSWAIFSAIVNEVYNHTPNVSQYTPQYTVAYFGLFIAGLTLFTVFIITCILSRKAVQYRPVEYLSFFACILLMASCILGMVSYSCFHEAANPALTYGLSVFCVICLTLGLIGTQVLDSKPPHQVLKVIFVHSFLSLFISTGFSLMDIFYVHQGFHNWVEEFQKGWGVPSIWSLIDFIMFIIYRISFIILSRYSDIYTFILALIIGHTLTYLPTNFSSSFSFSPDNSTFSCSAIVLLFISIIVWGIIVLRLPAIRRKRLFFRDQQIKKKYRQNYTYPDSDAVSLISAEN